MNSTAKVSTRPWISGRSRLTTASIAMLPMPGYEKIFSTSTVPPTRKVSWTPASVRVGTRALRRASRPTMRAREKPFTRAIRM